MDYETEEQQIKALKDWWRENGGSIIIGLVIGVGGFFGYSWWNAQTINKQENASMAYSDLVKIDAKTEEFITAAQKVKAEYGSSGYAVLASLHLAKQQVEKEDYAKAELELRWAADRSQSVDLANLIKIRLARVLNAQQKFADAETLLKSIESEAYKGLVQQVLGDTFLAQGKSSEARVAYSLAKENNDNYAAQNELEMIVNDLASPVVPVTTETTDNNS